RPSPAPACPPGKRAPRAIASSASLLLVLELRLERPEPQGRIRDEEELLAVRRDVGPTPAPHWIVAPGARAGRAEGKADPIDPARAEAAGRVANGEPPLRGAVDQVRRGRQAVRELGALLHRL